MKAVFEKRAVKSLGRMQPKLATAFRSRLAAIATDPFARHSGVEPLKGTDDAFRLRIGDWRALYIVDRDTREVVVQTVDPRGGAYKP